MSAEIRFPCCVQTGDSVEFMHEPAKKVREDKERALLYLQWLATALEDGTAGHKEPPA